MIDEHLYTVDTPEQIDLVYDVAGIGSRILAALLDHILMLLILSLGYVVTTLLIENLVDLLDTTLVFSIFGILVYLFMCAYYIFFETTWNGQTPGKRMVGIRMVRVGGRPLGFLGSTIRNIIRLADFLPILYGVGVLVMFIDRQSRRLGDMAAGSLAVRDRKAVTLDMLTAAPIVEAPVVMAADQQNIPNLTVLHPEDFAMVETYLRRRTQIGPEVRKRLDNTILDGLEQRLGYPVQRDSFNVEQFLLRVAAEHLLLLRGPVANNGSHLVTSPGIAETAEGIAPVAATPSTGDSTLATNGTSGRFGTAGRTMGTPADVQPEMTSPSPADTLSSDRAPQSTAASADTSSYRSNTIRDDL